MLQVKQLTFGYQNNKILHDLNFSVEKGKNLAVIGESGCGKSTLLKLIYGLYDLDEGHIFWNETEVLGPKFNLVPGMSFMKYLAQDFDLMPYITVAENVGKFLSNFYPEKKKERILELLEIVEMTEYADVKAKFLSGGQMQRIAIARVLALEPEVLLLDEPFSHIDNFRKNSLRRKLFDYLNKQQITCIVATHDSTDVLSFADEVIVMKSGSIVAYGTPKVIFDSPSTKYTASLFGDVNEIPGYFFNGNLDDNTLLYIYPHQLQITDYSLLKVNVKKNYFRGSHYLIEAMYDNKVLFFENNEDIAEDSIVYLKQKTLK